MSSNDILRMQHEEHMFLSPQGDGDAPRTGLGEGRASGHDCREVPAGANFVVNNKEVPVPAVNPVFVSPPLEPGKEYFYDCKVATVLQDGKNVTKIKRVKVRPAGELVRINYEEMETH